MKGKGRAIEHRTIKCRYEAQRLRTMNAKVSKVILPKEGNKRYSSILEPYKI